MHLLTSNAPEKRHILESSANGELGANLDCITSYFSLDRAENTSQAWHQCG